MLSFHSNWSQPEGKSRKLIVAELCQMLSSIFSWDISLLCTEPSVWVWIWSHVCLGPVCVHCNHGLQHHMSHYCTVWWVACWSYRSHTVIKSRLHGCAVFLQVSSTWCWSTWLTNTTFTSLTCQLAVNTASTWEPLIRLWPHRSSAWYGFTSSLSSE